MRQLFATEGPVFEALRTIGNIIIATIFWIIGCIPVITIGASTAAFYYCMIKSVRKDAGYVHKEFWRSYKMNLKNGIISTLIFALFFGVFGYEMVMIYRYQMEMGASWTMVARVVMVLAVLELIYLFPIMSRFDMPLSKMWILAVIMSIRFFYFTILLAVGLGLVIYLQIFVLPLPLVLLTPGAWCYISTFLIERAMKAYMPKTDTENADEKAWYE